MSDERPGPELVIARSGSRVDGKRLRHLLPADQTPERILALMRDAGLTDAAENGRGRRSGPLGRYVFYRAGA
jgi:hypothetical protein